jgi:hypothetical protein
MSETAVLAYWKEHREQLRQSETQRATMTNFLLVIVGALSALVVQQRFALATLPLSGLICLLGIYGLVATAKYYERAAYHLAQARALTTTLVDMGALGPEERLDSARAVHNSEFRRLVRIRLHVLWLVLHGLIVFYGLALLVITVTT